MTRTIEQDDLKRSILVEPYSISSPKHLNPVPAFPAPIEATPAPELSMQHLKIQLQYEQCLNRLERNLKESLTLYLEQEQLAVGSTVDMEAQIWRLLVQELSTALEGEGVAIALPRRDADDQTYTICQRAVSSSSSQSLTQPRPLGLLAPGRSLCMEPGQFTSLDDLVAGEAHSPQRAWPLGSCRSQFGFLLVCPLISASDQSESTPSDPDAQSLRIQLIERGLQQALAALRQLSAYTAQIQSLLARNRELEQTNRLKSEFLANTSHEIRTPLSSILGFTHLIREQGGYSVSNPRHQEYLNIILTSGQHLLALINDILDLSKIEANQLDLHWEAIDLPPLCQTALTLVREKASDKGLGLKLAIDPEIAQLVGDPLRLKQMLFNLLSNAVKFTVSGTIGLEVTHEGGTILFCVWDTGTGISAEQRSLLFRPYSQIANIAAGSSEGTGLGLALTQKLAELHGGRVTVESEAGQGSRFTIALPIRPTGLSTPPAPIAARESPKSTSIPPARSRDTATLGVSSSVTPNPVRRLLLVEDNHYNAKLMLTCLGKLGYDLLWVENGQEMWQALKKKIPALILMDIQLPGVDGLTLIQELRDDPRYGQIPIIAQTAMAMTGDRQTCLAAGATDYISKPLDLKNLPQVIAKYVPLDPTTPKPAARSK
jgi:signal transduction histidine kinase/ActR/RegA family two-component response regulator